MSFPPSTSFSRPSTRLGLFALLPSVALALGCGSDDSFEAGHPFENEEHVKVWAMSASAVGVYAHAYESIGVADGELDYSDPSCPVTSDDGTTLTVTGGCTDAGERAWQGRATVVRSGDDRTLTFDDFNGNDGTVTVRRVGATRQSFDAELVIGGVTTIRYSGTVDGGYGEPTTWNGSGRVTREGMIAPIGSVLATTEDEVVNDPVCSGQPASGSTTLEARGDTAVVTYDGATDCDEEQSARLSVSGVDRGLISGIGCATASIGADGAGRGSAWVAVFVALLTNLRRKVPRRRRVHG